MAQQDRYQVVVQRDGEWKIERGGRPITSMDAPQEALPQAVAFTQAAIRRCPTARLLLQSH